MSVAIESFASIFRPRDSRSRSEWSEEHVKPPGSARSTAFSQYATPWMVEPIDWSADNSVREMVLLMPTGAGKTTLIDCLIPHSITEDPGGILLVLQTDPDAREYVEERLMPILRGASPVQHILAGMDRHSIRKDCVMFPHLPLYMNGAKITALQRRSVRYVIGDEVWVWKHGMVGEARARTHDRWNARIVLLSQGGMVSFQSDMGPIETELETAWQRTDRREWSWECPECGEVQRYRQKCLRYTTAEDSRGNPDENGIMESAHFICAGALKEVPTCSARFDDRVEVRRSLATSARYVVQNPTHMERHHGWHMHGTGLYFVKWGQLAVEHAAAMRALKHGDETRIRIYRQKRCAENYREEEQTQPTALTVGDYTFADYANGELWPGEAVRVMTVDVQRDHFWVVARAWKADGSSRRLWCGRVNTKEALREMQQRLNLRGERVFVDCGYAADEVYNFCAEFGWWAIKGDGGATGYRFDQRGRPPVFKFYSPFRAVVGSRGRPCNMFFWAVLPTKRILEKMRGGYRAAWEVEKDMDPEHHEQLFSEIEKDVVNKTTKKVTRLFVRLGGRANHLWDAESMNVVGALIAGMLTDRPEPATATAAPAVSIDTDGTVNGEP